MAKKCIGLIEAKGLAAAIEVADTAVKSADVRLIGYEYSGYDGMIVVKIEGKVGAVQSAIAAARLAVNKVHGLAYSFATMGEVVQKSTLDESVDDILIHNKNTVGDPLQVASGKRPQGTTRQAKWVGHWEQKGAYIRE